MVDILPRLSSSSIWFDFLKKWEIWIKDIPKLLLKSYFQTEIKENQKNVMARINKCNFSLKNL